MKSGETGYLKISIANLPTIALVEKIIFTLKKTGGEAISKEYPTDVTFDGEKFLIPLTQSDTEALNGYYQVEAQINFIDKSVSKSDVTRKYMADTLATEEVEENEPSADQVSDIPLAISEVQIVNSGSGSISWGSITGDIESQTDLKTALDGKADSSEVDSIPLGDYYNIKNPVKYRVGLCSDIHLGYWDGQNDFVRALNTFSEVGCDFVGFCGDIQSLTYLHIEEYEKFTEVMSNAQYVGGETFFACRGNHDVFVTDEQWKSITGCKTNYYFEKDGDVYLFLSPSKDPDIEDETWVVDWTESVNYLNSIKPEINGKRIFAFVHYPFYGHAGVQPNKAYGFRENDANGKALYEYFKSQKAIVFGGHSHISFRDEDKQSNLNIDRDGTNHFATVHLMSTAQARDYYYSDNRELHNDVSEATIMDVCDGYVVIHCVDLVEKEIINSYVVLDDLGYTRKGLIDNIYTYTSDTDYSTEITNGKTAYSNLFADATTIDTALKPFHTKALDKILNKPTNLISTSIDTDGNVYNGVGYRENVRLNSNATETDCDGYGATGYIPITKEDTFYLYNCNFVGDTNTGKDYVCLYNENFTKISSNSAYGSATNNYVKITLDDNGYITTLQLGTTANAQNAKYFRISASGINADAEITKE